MTRAFSKNKQTDPHLFLLPISPFITYEFLYEPPHVSLFFPRFGLPRECWNLLFTDLFRVVLPFFSSLFLSQKPTLNVYMCLSICEYHCDDYFSTPFKVVFRQKLIKIETDSFSRSKDYKSNHNTPSVGVIDK